MYWFILTGTGESDGLRGHMVIRINISHGTIYYKKNKMSTEGNESRKCTTKSIIEEAEPTEKRGD